jgi:Cytochrome c554 and c-prime
MRQGTDLNVSSRKKHRRVFGPAVLAVCCLISGIVLRAQEGYVGAQVCGSCHPQEYKTQSQSNHANTLHPASTIARLEVPGGSAAESTEINAARFEFRKASDEYSVIVKLGDQQKQIPIDWIFGAADQGYTFFSRLAGGQFLEHRLSYYKRKGGFDITPGQRVHTPLSLQEAMGMRLSSNEAFRCLHCHSTYVKQTPDGPDFNSVVPGVTCERCHGPGAAHVNAIRAGAAERRILNPAKLSGDDLLLLCGECHRSEPPPGMLFDDPVLTRFQPVGLQLSACFQKSNAGITCTTCHSPHEDARRNAADFYDRRCIGCHNGTSRVKCKVQPAGECVSCHMAKTRPLPYMIFTDHWIRGPARVSAK